VWPRSERWDATVTRTHDLLAYADFLVDGDVLLSTFDNLDIGLVAGSVRVAEGAIRRTASVSLVDSAGLLVPVVEKNLIIPGTCELRLWAGVRYWDYTPAEKHFGDDTEYVPIFTGPILDYDLSNYPQVELTCSDRMWYVQRPFSTPYTVVAGQAIDDAIESLLKAKVPPAKLEVNLPISNHTTSLLVYDEQADPADALRSLGTASGWTVYVDSMGTFVAEDEPELDESHAVMTYEAGPSGALIRPNVTGSVQNVINTWIVTGESPSETALTPWAKVVDDDPTSPTYVRGTYDEQPRFIHSPILKTDAQCLLAANTYRKREGGIADSVSVTVLPNPALEKGDVVKVVGGLVDRYVIVDSFELNLQGAAQEITARAGTPVIDNG
jgi:hypothetical protein